MRMARKKLTVAIVYNQTGKDIYEVMKNVDPATLPFTPEYRIDVATEVEEYQAIAKALEGRGYRVRLVNIRDKVTPLLSTLKKGKPDVVFNLVEGFQDTVGLENSVAAVFDLLGIPYTGSQPFALSLCLRKGLTKQVLLASGIPTPRFRQLTQPKFPRRHGLHYPLIVKPAKEDASVGVDAGSVVNDLDALTQRVNDAFQRFSPPILIEEFIDGRELHVAILGNTPPQVLPILEYDFSELPGEHPPILSYDVKWDPLKEAYHRIHTICPAKLSKEAERRVRQRALDAYLITGCRDYARVDIRLSPSNKVYVLEVNPNPDLTEGVSFMESAENAGYGFGEALQKIVAFAVKRKT